MGHKDAVIPAKIGRTAASLIPGARLVLLGSGHVPYTTDPAAVAAELVPFADAALAGSAEHLAA